MGTSLKQQIVEDFKNILNKFYQETGSKEITRKYFLKHSKFQRKYEKFYTFLSLKKQANIENDKILLKTKKYIVSSIVAGAKNNEHFLNAMLRYCLKNKAQLLLIPLRGANKELEFDKHVIKNWGKYFISNYDFNSNLKLINTGITANNRNPLYRLKELGHKGYSVIVGACKQRMEIIPSLKTGKTHLVYSTGTVSYPQYKNNITGFLNNQNKKIGGLIVEIIDDKFFNIRNIEWIKDNFIDLNQQYYFNKVKNIEAEAIVAGDLHISGDEDKEALKILKEQIKFLRAKKLFIHDLASHNSINHHESSDLIKTAHNKWSLQEEHKSIRKALQAPE